MRVNAAAAAAVPETGMVEDVDRSLSKRGGGGGAPPPPTPPWGYFGIQFFVLSFVVSTDTLLYMLVLL